MKNRFIVCIIWVGITVMSASPQPLVIAHRGNSSAAPENTLAAVHSALALDPMPPYIEIDIHRSKDGVIVVSHDDNTRKTTGVNAMIREKSFDWLRTLDAGYQAVFGDQFKNEPLPRLEEVLDAVKDKPVGIMIESKQLLLEDQVIEMLTKRNEVEKHIFASFDEMSVFRAKQMEPKLRTLYLNSKYSPAVLWRAKDVQADIVGIQHTGIEPVDVDTVKENGFHLWLWTIDETDDMKRWTGAEVDGIITNYPANALTITTQK